MVKCSLINCTCFLAIFLAKVVFPDLTANQIVNVSSRISQGAKLGYSEFR